MSVQSNRLRDRRKLLGLSQQEIGVRIGTNQAQISKYEQGSSIPSSEVLAELARVLDVPSDWLLGLSDEVIPCLHEKDLSKKERTIVTALRDGKPLKAVKTIVLDAEKEDAE